MFRALLSLAGSGLAAAALAVVPASAATGCAQAILQDWRDGRIDHVYTPACYRQALAYLPEDLRVYSSAEADISRALQARLTTLTERTMMRPRSQRTRTISDRPQRTTTVPASTATAGGRPPGERAASAAGASTRANAFPLPVLVFGILAFVLVVCGPGVAAARRLRR